MSLDVRFKPLPVWNGKATPPASRRQLPGEQTYTQILDRLESELKHLGARDIVIETGHKATATRNDGWLRSDAPTPAHPGAVLWFDAKATRGGKVVGELHFACDRYANWKDNLRAIILTLEDLRKIENRGATQSGEQYTGYAALPAMKTPPDLKEAAARLLIKYANAVPSVTVTEILTQPETARAVYSEAVKKAHPDVSNNRIEYNAVRAAYDTIRGVTA